MGTAGIEYISGNSSVTRILDKHFEHMMKWALVHPLKKLANQSPWIRKITDLELMGLHPKMGRVLNQPGVLDKIFTNKFPQLDFYKVKWKYYGLQNSTEFSMLDLILISLYTDATLLTFIIICSFIYLTLVPKG